MLGMLVINGMTGATSLDDVGKFLDRVLKTKTPGDLVSQGDGSDERVVSAFDMFEHDADLFGPIEDMKDVKRMVAHLKEICSLDDCKQRICKVASMGVASVGALKAMSQDTPTEPEFPFSGRNKGDYDTFFIGLARHLEIATSDAELVHCFSRAARLAAGYLADRADVLPEAEQEENAKVTIATHPFMVDRVLRGSEGPRVAYRADEDERVVSALQMLCEVSHDLPADEVGISSVAATLATAITFGDGPARTKAIAETGASALRIVAERDAGNLAFSVKFPAFRSEKAYDAQFCKLGCELLTTGEDAVIAVLQEVVCLALGYISDRATPVDEGHERNLSARFEPGQHFVLDPERVKLAFQRLEERASAVEVASMERACLAMAASAVTVIGAPENLRMSSVVEAGAIALKVLEYLDELRPSVITSAPEDYFETHFLAVASDLRHPKLPRFNLVAHAARLVRLVVGYLVVLCDQPQKV